MGRLGQFDVVVDGEVICSRGGKGVLQRLFGGGFPDPEEVLAKLDQWQRRRPDT